MFIVLITLRGAAIYC